MSCVCTSCRHRSSHSRNREKERNERISERKHDRSSNTEEDDIQIDMQEDYISNLVETENYDAMFKCLNNEIKEIRKLKNDYFGGKLTDNEVKERAMLIEKKYEPIVKKLEEADSNGELNYNQHKKQLNLISERIKIYIEIFNKLGDDFENAFN